MKELHLEIAGMTCGHCVARLRQALARLPGVSVSEVLVGQARLNYEPSQIDEVTIRGAVDDLGFRVVEARS